MTFKEFKDRFGFAMSVIALLLLVGSWGGYYIDSRISEGEKEVGEKYTRYADSLQMIALIEAVNKNTLAIHDLSEGFVGSQILQGELAGRIIEISEYVKTHK